MRKHRGATTGITTFTTSIYDAVGGKIQIGLSTTQTAALKPADTYMMLLPLILVE